MLIAHAPVLVVAVQNGSGQSLNLTAAVFPSCKSEGDVLQYGAAYVTYVR